MPRPLFLLRRTGAALLCAWACTAWAQEAPPPAPSALALPLLPAPGAVQQALSALPALRAAQAQQTLAQARSQRLLAGPYDWVAKAGANRRRDNEGGRYNEAEIGLETTLRWPAKVATDRQLAAQTLQLGDLGAADAWHEAARSLLTDWFEALRATRSAALWQAQDALMARLLRTTQKRVDTGEAAPLELLAAQAEHARWQAQALQAHSLAQLRTRSLQLRYPLLSALPTPSDAQLAAWPAATEALPDAATWVQRVLQDNHELELAQAQAEQARLQAERSAQEHRPDPTLGWRATRERGGQERVLGVYLSLPLGSSGRAADAQAAQAQAEVAAQEREQVRQRITLEAQQRAQEAHSSRLQLAQQRLALAQIDKSAQLQERAYALGETPLMDLLQAQRAALEARQQADGAALDALQAQARLLLDAHQLWTPAQHRHPHHAHQDEAQSAPKEDKPSRYAPQ